MRPFIVGSRASQLALAQTKAVIRSLSFDMPDLNIDIKKIMTTGDKVLNQTLSKIGGKGLFVKEIEEALLRKEIDFAVHSMKDLPGDIPEGLIIASIVKREDPRDCLVSRGGKCLHELPEGSKIGTSSLRRQAQVLRLREDIVVEPVRGNIHTRLRKMNEGQFDAIILAVSGLLRMNWMDQISEIFHEGRMLPSAGQGALAIQCREDDLETIHFIQRIHDKSTAKAVHAERSFLRTLEGDCHLPVAALAEVDENQIQLKGLVTSQDGSKRIEGLLTGCDEWRLGKDLAQQLIQKGALALLGERES